ncbi:MAG: hypothetical protein ABI181_04480 [Mycobacteriaceae bacterium]
MVFLLCFSPAVLFGLLWRLFPADGAPPRWRLRVASLLERVAGRLRRRPPPGPDPFVALRLQTRLGVVAANAQRLENDPAAFARAQRLIAMMLAYDQLLEEACVLAGVEAATLQPNNPDERFRKEVELTARGWSW